MNRYELVTNLKKRTKVKGKDVTPYLGSHAMLKNLRDKYQRSARKTNYADNFMQTEEGDISIVLDYDCKKPALALLYNDDDDGPRFYVSMYLEEILNLPEKTLTNEINKLVQEGLSDE